MCKFFILFFDRTNINYKHLCYVGIINIFTSAFIIKVLSLKHNINIIIKINYLRYTKIKFNETLKCTLITETSKSSIIIKYSYNVVCSRIVGAY